MNGKNTASQLVQRVMNVAEAAHDELSSELAEAVRAEIQVVGAVRSGRFMRTVKARTATSQGDIRRIVVASDAPYGQFPEFGRRPNAPGNGGYPGKFPHRRAIERRAGRIVRSAFTNRLARIGVHE